MTPPHFARPASVLASTKSPRSQGGDERREVWMRVHLKRSDAPLEIMWNAFIV